MGLPAMRKGRHHQGFRYSPLMPMNIGRNDPCHCGSGKKYKRCCIIATIADAPGTTHPIIMVNGIGDYGEPKVDEEFFKKHPLQESSAQRLLYSTLLRPELEIFARQLVRPYISRGKGEEKKIKRTNDTAGLVAILKEQPDPLNHRLLINKLLQLREAAVPMLVDELRQVQNDCFVELSAQIIHESKIDCSSALLKLLASSPHDAYALSIICLVLGMIGPKEALKPLWDCFHFFNAKYPKEHFSQGPWLGLYALSHRSSKTEPPRGQGKIDVRQPAS